MKKYIYASLLICLTFLVLLNIPSLQFKVGLFFKNPDYRKFWIYKSAENGHRDAQDYCAFNTEINTHPNLNDVQYFNIIKWSMQAYDLKTDPLEYKASTEKGASYEILYYGMAHFYGFSITQNKALGCAYFRLILMIETSYLDNQALAKSFINIVAKEMTSNEIIESKQLALKLFENTNVENIER